MFGDAIALQWRAHSWDDVFVQIRREADGELRESVTCNVTGLGDFTVNEAVWSLFDERTDADEPCVTVGFQNVDLEAHSGNDGQLLRCATALVTKAT